MQKSLPSATPRKPPNRAGARAFWQSRATALALVVLVPYALLVVLRFAGRDLALVQHSLSRPWIALPLLALVLAGVWHMWLGMNEILEDYVRKPALTGLLILNTVFCALVAIASAAAVVSLWFGSGS